MFYQEAKDDALRFGDVIVGFVLTAANVDAPDVSPASKSYSIDVAAPAYSVVLSPCCEIGDKTITLTPLISLRQSLFDNPYFVEDLTRINRKMQPEQALPPLAWQKLPEEEKLKRIGQGSQHQLLDLFVYERHDLFKKYVIHKKGGGQVETDYHMISFKNTYKVNCEKITTAKDSPIYIKCLQLSVGTRAELREKLGYYFGRPAPEDIDLLEDHAS